MFKHLQYISRDGKSLVFMVYTISILVPALWQCHWWWHMHTYWPRIWKCNVIQDWWGHVRTGSRLHSPPCYTGKQAPFNIQCLLLLTPLHYIHTVLFLIWTSGSPWSWRGNGRRTCTAKWRALLCWAPCTKEAEAWCHNRVMPRDSARPLDCCRLKSNRDRTPPTLPIHLRSDNWRSVSF